MKMNKVDTNLINLFAFETVEIQDILVDLTQWLYLLLLKRNAILIAWKIERLGLNRSSEGRYEEVNWMLPVRGVDHLHKKFGVMNGLMEGWDVMEIEKAYQVSGKFFREDRKF